MKSILFQSRGGVLLVFVMRVLGVAAAAAIIVHMARNLTPVTIIVGMPTLFAIVSFTGFLKEKLDDARWQRGLHQDLQKKYAAYEA